MLLFNENFILHHRTSQNWGSRVILSCLCFSTLIYYYWNENILKKYNPSLHHFMCLLLCDSWLWFMNFTGKQKTSVGEKRDTTIVRRCWGDVTGKTSRASWGGTDWDGLAMWREGERIAPWGERWGCRYQAEDRWEDQRRAGGDASRRIWRTWELRRTQLAENRDEWRKAIARPTP